MPRSDVIVPSSYFGLPVFTAGAKGEQSTAHAQLRGVYAYGIEGAEPMPDDA